MPRLTLVMPLNTDAKLDLRIRQLSQVREESGLRARAAPESIRRDPRIRLETPIDSTKLRQGQRMRIETFGPTSRFKIRPKLAVPYLVTTAFLTFRAESAIPNFPQNQRFPI